MLINANQLRAARGLINWTVVDLAKKVGVAPTTISAIETGRSAGSVELLSSIIYAFQSAGIEITEDGGVRPRQSKILHYKGHDGFCAFFDDIYEVASTYENPDICITNVNEALYEEWLGSYEPIHVKRMSNLDTAKFRVLVKEQDEHLTSTAYCEYRWVSSKQFADVSLYMYGDKVAFIEFSEQDVTVTVVDNEAVTESMRKMFETYWDNAKRTLTE